MQETIPDILDEMAKSQHDNAPVYIYVTQRVIGDADIQVMDCNAASLIAYAIDKKLVTLDELRKRLAAAYNWQHADPDPTRMLLTRLVKLWGSTEITKYSQMAVLFDDAKEFLEHTRTKGGNDK